jgi:DNA-binding SARP family transcriptional activator/DNA-binding XRE family transcriptional regulator
MIALAAAAPGALVAATLPVSAAISQGRRRAGLTQAELADRAGVSVGALRDLEQGRTARPRRATAEKVSLVLGLDLGQVADGGGGLADDRRGPEPAGRNEVVAGVRVGVLGPLAVWRDGAPAGPGAGRLRAVLGLLALHPGSAMHRETIIDAVWPSEPPVSAVPMVQAHASRLRRLLGGGLLVSDGTSYRLAVTARQLDALEFGQLAARASDAAEAADPAAACQWYERALRLWRGEPLADVGLLRGHPAAAGLAQQRAAVIVGYADAAAATGCPERALPRLRALASQDPLDERVHARLMLTLAACGQQAAALSVFGQLNERLGDELGVTPGAELAEAHLRVLRGQVTVGGSAAGLDSGRASQNGGPSRPSGRRPLNVPRQLPAASAHLVGRDEEMATLTRLLDQVTDGTATVPVCAIGGMAGAGKTALAVRWAHEAAGRFPDGQLYVNLRGFDPSDTSAAPGQAIRGFLDALGVPPGQIPAAADSRAALYRSLTAGQRLLIVLDNALDEQQVRPLLPGTPGPLVIVTSRHQLTGLSAAEGARLLTLGPLTTAQARAMLAARLGPDWAAAEPHAAAEITALCGRLPLALAAAAARAAARPQLSLAALAADLRAPRTRLQILDTGDPAVSVPTAFSTSYRQLTPATARIFRLLGPHPDPDITIPAAASLAETAPGQAHRHLAELARAHLVSEHAPGRYTMHDLLRAYAAGLAETSDDQADRPAAGRPGTGRPGTGRPGTGRPGTGHPDRARRPRCLGRRP